MSAFTPYKRKSSEVGADTPPGKLHPRDLIPLPYGLTSLLLTLPATNVLDLTRRESEEERRRKRTEGFLIKNILRREEDDRERERKERGGGRRFEDHASRVETLVSNLGKSEHGHRCIYCGKVYSRKYGLKIHVRTHTGYKPLKCKFCARPFGDPSNLNKHVRLHAQGPTPYKCQFCAKLLVRRRDLDRHIKSRHGNPPQ